MVAFHGLLVRKNLYLPPAMGAPDGLWYRLLEPQRAGAVGEHVDPFEQSVTQSYDPDMDVLPKLRCGSEMRFEPVRGQYGHESRRPLHRQPFRIWFHSSLVTCHNLAGGRATAMMDRLQGMYCDSSIEAYQINTTQRDTERQMYWGFFE